MSWFSNLVETYDRVAGAADVLLPRNHMMAKTDICVTLDGSGKFLRAEESGLSIYIPCTEDSASRTVAIHPHPLHEQLGYLAFDERKRNSYLSLLEKWCNYHPKIEAVYTYIVNGSLPGDLQNSCIKADSDTGKLFVRFRVEIFNDHDSNLWEDKKVAKAWQTYCYLSDEKEKKLCYATGVLSIPAVKHPKGTSMSTYGAKLVSCNDETNYTYKGRFVKSEQANTISAEASHKAHAMLKYLIANQGYKCDSQAIVVWAVDDGSVQADLFEDSLGLCGAVIQTEKDKIQEAQGKIATDYARQLREVLSGKGNVQNLDNQLRRVAVMAMDAATTGRMGITFYQDLSENEYVERIITWHESCCWWFSYAGQAYISAPSVDRIIAAVYGEPKGESYNKIKKQARERLLYHIICGQPLDRSWVSAAVNRVSQPFSYNKQDGGWDKWKWETALSVVCAIVKKYNSRKKEGVSLELDDHYKDRSYLFGRLLAIADKLESHARYLQTGKSDTDKRPTNAVRYMSAFASKPMRTWKLIFSQLNPYIQRLNGANWYQRQIDEIISLFVPEEFNDKPLDGKYLLGYSLQRRMFDKSNIDQDKEEDIHEPIEKD